MSFASWIAKFVIAAGMFLLIACSTSHTSTTSNKPIEQPSGFEDVTSAKNGELVTVVDWIDQKYLCMDVTPTQREICTTALTRSDPMRIYTLEIRLWVCSEVRRKNCIVLDSDPTRMDMRKVYVNDDDGNPIDFDGAKLIEPPNTWEYDAVKLRLTGRVSVVNGKGAFVEPIEKIEAQ